MQIAQQVMRICQVTFVDIFICYAPIAIMVRPWGPKARRNLTLDEDNTLYKGVKCLLNERWIDFPLTI